MRLLVSHVNYPSQFRRLLPEWVSAGHEIIFIARQREWHAPQASGFKVNFYQVNSKNFSSSSSHPYLNRLESAIDEGQEVFRQALKLKNSGWYPDCIVSHVGFGNGLFLKDCFPLARHVGFVEWFYNAENSDVDFLPPYTVSDDHRLQLRIWNAECLLELSSLDTAVVPTLWQKQQFPQFMREKLHVIHEGVDVNYLSSLRASKRSRPCCLPPDPKVKVLTYVSRTFEDYRGFPQVINALSKVLQLCPDLHVLMIGQDGNSYGSPRADGLTWTQWAKTFFDLDPDRVHWLGSIQEDDYHNALCYSDVHVYLTVPFILSWSLLEAMSVGCSIVASNTQPVVEVLEDEYSALLVDFFDVSALVKSILKILSDKAFAGAMAFNAQQKAFDFSVEGGTRSWNQLLLAEGGQLLGC